MMKLWGNKGWMLVLLYLGTTEAIKAQRFRNQCHITVGIIKSGFFGIDISPELSACMQPDFGDVRILDDKGQNVPYIIRNRNQPHRQKNFVPLPVYNNTSDDSGRSVIIVKNSYNKQLSALSVIFKNSNVRRTASLSGSNDGKNWYIISNSILLNEDHEVLADSSIQSFSFPLSRYAFLQLTIDNEHSNPLNIRQIGYYNDEQENTLEPYADNPAPRFIQTDSNNRFSYISIIQNKPYVINKIKLKVGSPHFFLRRISIYQVDKTVADQTMPVTMEISSKMLSPDSVIEINIPVIKADTIGITIDNGSNQPLQIVSIRTQQVLRELVAYLEKGRNYSVLMNAAEYIAPPQYELQLFKDSIPPVVNRIPVSSISPVRLIDETAKDKPFPRLYIWLIMLGIVALLGFLTWRLTAEMRKTTNS